MPRVLPCALICENTSHGPLANCENDVETARSSRHKSFKRTFDARCDTSKKKTPTRTIKTSKTARGLVIVVASGEGRAASSRAPGSIGCHAWIEPEHSGEGVTVRPKVYTGARPTMPFQQQPLSVGNVSVAARPAA